MDASAHRLRLRVKVPRALLDPGAQGEQPPLPAGDHEGLLAVELDLAEGRIESIQAAARPHATGQQWPLALPPLLEPHAHLDKAFSWSGFANPEGSMAGALAANSREAAARSADQVLMRGERALEQGWRYGLRAIRSHIDSGGPQEQPSWEALQTLRQRWAGRLELQLVALVPLAYWSTTAGAALAQRVAAAGGLLGAVLGPPFSEGYRHAEQLGQLLGLAEQHGCGIDLHIDESDSQPALGLRLLLRELRRRPVHVPITCSHACSLSLLTEDEQRRLAGNLAAQGVAVVALPTAGPAARTLEPTGADALQHVGCAAPRAPVGRRSAAGCPGRSPGAGSEQLE